MNHSHWGVLCPAETPEGESCGLMQNISFMTHIRIGHKSDNIRLLVLHENDTRKLLDCSTEYLYRNVRIFVNGTLIGITTNPDQLMQRLIIRRQVGDFPHDTSLTYLKNEREIIITTDSGDPSRPVFILKNIHKLEDTIREYRNFPNGIWNALLEEGIIQYMDKEEERMYLIAPNLKHMKQFPNFQYTHIEIHPCAILGLCANLIPFPEHNQCIETNEPVLMFDGSRKPIGDIQVGDDVITFNPETQEQSISKIVQTYSGPTEKKMYELTTFSERKIKATYDHKFMTFDGWMSVEDIVIDETLVGISLEPDPIVFTRQKNIWLTEKNFKERCQQFSIRDGIIEKHALQLKDLGLLPLCDTDDRIYILARLFGFCLTDGCVFVSNGVPRMSADFGKRYSSSLFEQDLVRIGIPERTARYYEKVLHGYTLRTWKVEHSRYVSSLLIALGFNPGKKTVNEYPRIGSWIMEGNTMTKREFLSAFQGGDGCRIRWNRTKSGFGFVIAETSKQSCFQYHQSLKNMMSQIVSLLREFQIDVADVVVGSTKADDRLKVSFKISNCQENLVRYFDRIGYRYDIDKVTGSGIAVEYIKMIHSIKKEKAMLVQEVKKLYSAGCKPMEISETLRKDVKQIRKICYSEHENVGIPKLKNTKWSIESWVERVRVKGTTLFMPIKQKTRTESTIIADITTESSNHSFIAGNNFCVHNSPRNMYSSSMQKQRMSIFATNFLNRLDTISYALTYGQEPLVQTFVDQLMHGNELPSGQNPIVAVCTYTGYNCEDAIIVNRASIERGLFRAEIFRTYRDEEMSGANNSDGPHFHKVDPTDKDIMGLRKGNYDTLEDDGLPPLRIIVQNNDAVIGKIIQTPEGKRDLTTFVKTNEKAQVCKVMRTVGRDDRNAVMVQTRATRIPEIGDKFSSLHGQKGVIGMILNEEDMPFTVASKTRASVRPDFIVNPHGFPSRMTLAQQLEMLLGKALCISGEIGDGTAFQNDMNFVDNENVDRREVIYNFLKEHGYQPHGEERMINGMTGELMEASIFMCPVQYQRLRHMVQDKMHPRSTGPLAMLTRQPTEGRSKDGGLRFGEMEGDNVISHGAAAVLKDRLFEQSDIFSLPVCEKCGLLAETRKVRGMQKYSEMISSSKSFYCRNCDSTESIIETHLPYVTSLSFSIVIMYY